MTDRAELIAWLRTIAYPAAADMLETEGDKLDAIRSWANAYPESVFPPPTDDELKAVAAKIGHQMMTRLHWSWGRHITAGILDIIDGKEPR